MSTSRDVATAIGDLVATVALCILGWTSGSPWWWILASAWAVLTARQIKLTHLADTHRTVVRNQFNDGPFS